jgi:hypothetical protein
MPYRRWTVRLNAERRPRKDGRDYFGLTVADTNVNYSSFSRFPKRRTFSRSLGQDRVSSGQDFSLYLTARGPTRAGRWSTRSFATRTGRRCVDSSSGASPHLLHTSKRCNVCLKLRWRGIQGVRSEWRFSQCDSLLTPCILSFISFVF